MKSHHPVRKTHRIKSIAALICASLALSAATPRQANAWILVNPGHEWIFGSWDPYSRFAGVTLCLAILPICLLDQKGSSDSAVTSSDLADNGYSPTEIQQILKDQQVLSENLKKSKSALIIQSGDTRSSLIQDIRKLHPGVSDSYLAFFSENAALQK